MIMDRVIWFSIEELYKFIELCSICKFLDRFMERHLFYYCGIILCDDSYTYLKHRPQLNSTFCVQIHAFRYLTQELGLVVDLWLGP